MSRRRREDDHENLDRWLITYADLITLLLAFFIMMYTFSKQDAQKYQEVSGHLKTIFSGGTGILKTGPGTIGTNASPLLKPGGSGDLKEELENEVKTIANTKEMENKISIIKDDRGVVIRIMDRAFFDEGHAELKNLAKNALDKIVPVIQASSRQIRIEGHTDNMPISRGEFKSNWELSVRRATEVVRYLIEAHGFPPSRISASGYAEYRPIVTNDTPDNRALNRRIEIILLQPTSAEVGIIQPVKTDVPKVTP